MISLGFETRNVGFLCAHDRARIRFRKRFSKAAIEFNVRRQQPIAGINYQNVFDFFGRGCRRSKTHEHARENHLPHEYGSQSRERQVAVIRAQGGCPHETNPRPSINRGFRRTYLENRCEVDGRL